MLGKNRDFSNGFVHSQIGGSYEFEEYRRKTLINAERLYLIEYPNGLIYESEIESFMNWRIIRKSKIYWKPQQVYCSYNKGSICISTISDSAREYYYFNLDQKIIIDVAYYNKHVSFRRAGKQIEVNENNQSFKPESYYTHEWNLKGIPLSTLGENIAAMRRYDKAIKNNPNNPTFYYYKGDAYLYSKRYLEAIECYDKAIKLDPSNTSFYGRKGYAFDNLQRYLEAIECYGQALKLNPEIAHFYDNKGESFHNLKKYQIAIECYDEAIKLLSNVPGFYANKGYAFYSLKRYLEAIECYDEAINLNPRLANFYVYKGYAFYGLKRYPEAIVCYDEAIKIKPYKAKYYNDKGNTLYVLERYQEAIQCYDQAIKLKPDNPLYFCNRARAFNNLRQEEAALKDFNKAYSLKQKNQVNGVFTGDEWKLSEEDINFINEVLGRDRIELLQKMQI